MQPAETCEACKRPKYTDEDLARWRAEFGDDYRGSDPEWARALCWTKRDTACHCKPPEASQ